MWNDLANSIDHGIRHGSRLSGEVVKKIGDKIAPMPISFSRKIQILIFLKLNIFDIRIQVCKSRISSYI